MISKYKVFILIFALVLAASSCYQKPSHSYLNICDKCGEYYEYDHDDAHLGYCPSCSDNYVEMCDICCEYCFKSNMYKESGEYFCGRCAEIVIKGY